MTHLGRYIRSQRLHRRLTPQQLAVLLGYKNTAKGARRILNLEQKGDGAAELLAKVAAVLKLSPEGVEFARELDERVRHERDNVRRPTYLVIRCLPGIYANQPLPEEITNQAEAEEFACLFARKNGMQVCLGWRGRQLSWINRCGEVYARTEN